VAAFIVLAPGAETTGEELLAWCQEHLAAHQVPAVVTFVDRLPRNSVGKLIRAELHNAATLTPPRRGR
jgi:long-chain acyl-CoA synthetase